MRFFPGNTEYFHRMDHPYIGSLLKAVTLEEKEESNRFRLDQQHTLKMLKSEGLALHPIQITRRSFGYADYPEFSFRINYPTETRFFRDGASVECFMEGEEPVKAVLLNLDGKNGECRLFAPDFPEWLEEKSVGIKLAPDVRTIDIMKKTLRALPGNKNLYPLFERLHAPAQPAQIAGRQKPEQPDSASPRLNSSQQQAVSAILHNEDLTIVHGPPGTGKTSTLVEAIIQLVKQGHRVLVSAPSNTATDHIAHLLISKGLDLLRVGNSSKADKSVWAHTPEGKLGNSKQQKEIKLLKQRAEEFRRMALKYKRSFGKAEREQRNLLFKEVKQIRDEIKKIQAYNEGKLYADAKVIAGTPIALYDARLDKMEFDSLIIDEAGQCIEPLAWCIFPLAKRLVLAGDHLQLPPTVLSQEATALGLNLSILEIAIAGWPEVTLLNTQYRMRELLAGFSSAYFYGGLLQTATHLANNGVHLVFIDTAGSGFHESPGTDNTSLENKGELELTQKLLEEDNPELSSTAFISPYSGQVAAARELLPKTMRISTIDSFQGQESVTVILSLVRSNDDGIIGFLKDYRRMNVAITRAKEKLYIIGDSATIGHDPFYNALLTYIEKNGEYKTSWDYSF